MPKATDLGLKEWERGRHEWEWNATNATFGATVGNICPICPIRLINLTKGHP